MKKNITYIALFLSLIFIATSCSDPLYSSLPSESDESGLSEATPSISASESPSEPVTFPRVVCKEGQWFLETGIREEDLPEPNHFSSAWAVTFDSYEDFVRRIKEVDFTEEQLAYMEPLMVYYYGYQENGALAIPDPALLENFSFPFLGDSRFQPEMSTVYWGLSEGICIYPSTPRGPGGPGGDYIVIYEKDDYNEWFKLLEEEWEKGFFETAETEEVAGLIMYLRNDDYVYRVETELFTAWIKRSGTWKLYFKEKNGLSYSYFSEASDDKALEQIKAVFEKYGYEFGE